MAHTLMRLLGKLTEVSAESTRTDPPPESLPLFPLCNFYLFLNAVFHITYLLCVEGMCYGTCVLVRGQLWGVFWESVSPAIMQAQGINLRLSGLPSGAFTD